MEKLMVCFIAVAIICFGYTVEADESGSEDAAKAYLKELEARYTEACNKNTIIRWEYSVNVTKENEELSNAASNAFFKFQADIQKEINDKFSAWDKFKDPHLVREFKNLATTGPGNMSKESVEKMNALQSKMESIFAQATVCQYKNPSNCTYHLDPELTNILKTSKDYDELSHYWTSWHDTLGSKVSADDFAEFSVLQNEMAVANRFKDMSDYWADAYDDGSQGFNADTFMKDMGQVWNDLKPYYSKLHAYVRMKLRPIYKEHIGKDGYIPINVVGNMWAQDWTNLDTVTKPYPETPSLDATEAMVAAKFDVERMFKESDKFFGGLGLQTMTDTFWNKSMLTKPTDGREVVCHPTAEDFCTGKINGDYRIKMCAQVNMDDLVTVHHEMGHVEYYMQYKEEDFIFRSGANPGFHEAIGDALGLAVTTPAHLTCVLDLDLGLDIDCGEEGNETETEQAGRRFKVHRGKAKGHFKHNWNNWKAKKGLNSTNADNKTDITTKAPPAKKGATTKVPSKGAVTKSAANKTKGTVTKAPGSKTADASTTPAPSGLPPGVTKMDINFLYYKALEKFAFFPFSLVIDIWRFEVFSGKLKKEQYTDRWWELRKEYQGVIPPEPRKSSSFDPAAKYHIVANVEYIRYFVSHILQFQFYEAMCIAAGEYSRENPKKPLYQCDFTDSKEAGTVLSDMMKLGFSKPWPEALEKIAKTKKLSIEPLMNYFKPLFDKIEEELKKGNEQPCFGKEKC